MHLPGYVLQEFLIVLAPHEDLRQRISKVRDEFAEKYKSGGTRSLYPHITLVRFTIWSMMEEKIVQRLKSISMGMIPFKVELKDYGSFPSHSIFINVTSKLPIREIIRQLREAQRLMKLNNEFKPHFLEEPHILIGRKLKVWQFEQGWLEYANKQFTARFIADHMLLLKRKAGEKGGYQIVKRFDFQNLPVTTKQGSMF